jgi:hypothetical protein
MCCFIWSSTIFFCVVLFALSPFLCTFPLLLYNPFYQYWSLWRFPNPLISILFTPKCSCFKFKLLETNVCSDGATRNGWMTKTPHPIPPPPPTPPIHKGTKKRKEKKRKSCQTHHQLRASWSGILTKERQSNTYTHVMGKFYIFNKFEMKTSVSIICKRSMKPIVQEVEWPPCKFI